MTDFLMYLIMQANTVEELPEVLLGTCRLNYLDASKSVKERWDVPKNKQYNARADDLLFCFFVKALCFIYHSLLSQLVFTLKLRYRKDLVRSSVLPDPTWVKKLVDKTEFLYENQRKELLVQQSTALFLSQETLNPYWFAYNHRAKTMINPWFLE